MPICPAGHESQASDYCDTCGRVIGGAAAPAAAVSATAATVVAAVPARSGGCPVCGAGRDGRFCEECGYDFELAEAMPQTVLSPGVGPDEAQAPAAAAPGTGPAEQGLDIEAELARAEHEATGSSAAAEPPEPDPLPAPPPPAPPAPEPVEASTAGPEPDPAAGLVGFVGIAAVAGGAAAELSLVVDADPEYYAAQVERGDIIESEFPFPKYPAERRFSFTAGPVRIGRASSSRGLAPEIDLTGPPLDPAVSHLHAQLLRHEEGWVVVDLGSANGTRLNDAAEPLEAETEIPVKPGDRIHLGVWTTIIVQ